MKRIAVAGIPGAWSSQKLLKAVQEKTGYSFLIDMAQACLELDTGHLWCGETDLNSFDAIIVKKISPSYSPAALDRMEMLRHLHQSGVPVFSNPMSISRLIDRLSCTVSLRLGGIPMPPTVITEDEAQAADAVERLGAAVFKPLYSSKARGMTVIKAGEQAREEIQDFKAQGNPVMYIQKLVTHPGMDLGVSFLGGEYLGTYARQGSGKSWNTTTASGGKYVAHEPSPQIIELARKAQALFPGMAFTCVDVVETPEGAEVYEVSAFGGFRGLLDALGLDVAGLYVDYVLKRLK